MRTSTVSVCLLEENWRAALGEEPTRFFGR
jgi:hypothetical protein